MVPEIDTKTFIDAIQAGDIKLIQRVALKLDNEQVAIGLQKAIVCNQYDIAELLLPQLQTQENTKNLFLQLLLLGAQRGLLNIVQLLLPSCGFTEDNTAQGNEALLAAVEGGYTNVVEALVPYSNPKDDDNLALRIAIRQGDVPIVKLLIPVSNPNDHHGYLLQMAFQSYTINDQNPNHLETVKLLIPHCDYKLVIDRLNKNKHNKTVLQQCIDDYETLLQRDRLHQTLEPIAVQKTVSEKRKM